MKFKLSLGIFLLSLLSISMRVQAEDAVFLVTPDNQAAFRVGNETRVDFHLTQVMQKQFFDFLDVLSKNNIKSIIANGRAESHNSYNNNWFFVYKLNNSRFITILPQKDVHRSNVRPDYINYLFENNSYPIKKVNDFFNKKKNHVFFVCCDFVLDRKYRKFYYYKSAESLDYLFKAIAQDLQTTYTHLFPAEGTNLKVTQIINVNEQLAMVCSKCLADDQQYLNLKNDFIAQNKAIIEITKEQAAANVTDYMVIKANNANYIIINKNSFDRLTKEQSSILLSHGRVLIIDLSAFYKYNTTRLIDMVTLIN